MLGGAALEGLSNPSNNIGMTLAARIKMAREKKGMKKADLARTLGIKPVNITTWESGETAPARERMPDVARALDVTVDWLLNGDRTRDTPISPIDQMPLVSNVTLTHDRPKFVGRDFPVLGTADCGDGTFALTGGDPIDTVNRPAGLENRRDAYGVYVQGQSMQPVYDPGDLVYVDPRRPPMVGRDCVIQLKQKTDGGEVRCMLKRLLSRRGHKWTFQQFNPMREITLDDKEISAVHLVLKAHETNAKG
jgi:phage repressor protein C with HTH and peptisase S24 domain